eukprot:Rhum_TRINITY_DN10995_c0_g2::Rhum_TRINITY_DN10995_c0_g2_i1::g.41701::m.41701
MTLPGSKTTRLEGSAEGTAAAGTGTRSAPVAVRPQLDLVRQEGVERLDVPNGRGKRLLCVAGSSSSGAALDGRRHVEAELLVEVAVVEGSVPADADRVAAHQALDRRRVEVLHKQLHVLCKLVLLAQIVRETLHRQVRDREQLVEVDAERLQQLLLVRRLQRLLLRRQEGAQRVVHEVQRQPRARLAVPGGVELLQALDRGVEHAFAPLCVDVLRRVARHRRHHLDAVLCEEGRRVLVPLQRQHRQVAPVDHLDALRTRTLRQLPEVRVQLGRAARDVQGLDGAALLDQRQHPVHRRLVHVLRHAQRARLDVTVVARLVAQQADVHLDRLRLDPVQEGLLPALRDGVEEGGQPRLRVDKVVLALRADTLLPLGDAQRHLLHLLAVRRGGRRVLVHGLRRLRVEHRGGTGAVLGRRTRRLLQGASHHHRFYFWMGAGVVTGQ